MKYFLIGLQFLTRIKLANQMKWEIEDFGKSVPSFAAVGIIVGLLSALVYFLLLPFFGTMLTSLVVIAFHFLITGGIHADGFMDTCDGLFSGRDRERKLEIMKDSRVGSNGVLGFLFLILLKWQLLAHIPYVYAIPFLIILSLISKQGLTMSVCLFPYARKEGMGKAFAQYAPKNSFTISLIYLFVGAFLTLLVSPLNIIWELLIVIIAAFIVNQILNRYITKHLGGVTGDTYGFVSEITELICLFVFLLSLMIINK